MRWIGVLVLGCQGANGDGSTDTDTDTDTDADTDTDTDTDTVSGNFSVRCALAPDNVLRASCAATFPSAQTLAVTLSLGTEAPIAFTAEGPATDAVLPVWGLSPDQTWRWEASSVEDPSLFAEGTLTTPPLPGTLAGLIVAVDEGGAHGDEQVLFNYGCQSFAEALVVIDRMGRVRWYQEPSALPITPAPTSFRSLNVTPEGDVLALVERDSVVRWKFDGTVPLLLTRNVDFDAPLHHEVTRKNGLTYFLFAESVIVEGTAFVADGFYVFDDLGNQLGAWHMADSILPVEGGAAGGGYWTEDFPGAVDWSHSNALAVDDDLTVTVSLRFQDALIRVVGDPAAVDFGRVEWIVVGDDDSALTTTVPYTSTAGIAEIGFADQHHVRSGGPGELTLWDNHDDPAAGSRAMRFVATDTSLDLVEEWPVGSFCPGQGSATVLSSGNVLVDCAPNDTLAEVSPAGETVWSAQMSCGLGLMIRPLYRGLPIDLFPAVP